LTRERLDIVDTTLSMSVVSNATSTDTSHLDNPLSHPVVSVSVRYAIINIR